MSVFISIAIIGKPGKLRSLPLKSTEITVKDIGWLGKSLRIYTKSVKYLYLSNVATLCFFFFKRQWKVLALTRTTFVQQFPTQPFWQPFCQTLSFCWKWCFTVFYSCPKGPLGLLAVRWPKFPICIGHIVWSTVSSNNVFNAHVHPLEWYKE